ncbi:MAG: CBS domain-containing protein [Symploca sp. SIO1A3]|nr:CBS domain-containing protein [Symploca sp. SIO1A3]
MTNDKQPITNNKQQTTILNPLTTTPDTLVPEAIALMSQSNSSYILILAPREHHRSPVGLLTTTDVVRLTALGTDLSNLSLATVITKPLHTITQTQAQDSLAVVKILHQHRIRHLPVVDEEGHLVGIITPQSIQTFLKPMDLFKLKQVSEVMNTNVVQADKQTSIRSLTQLMTKEQVSCVVIVENSSLARGEVNTNSEPQTIVPVGIVTEREIIEFQNLGLEPDKASAATIMSAPVLSIKPADSMWDAYQMMQQQPGNCLIVTNDPGELVGIITQIGALKAINLQETEQTVATWQHLVGEQTGELRQLNEQLQQEIGERQILETHLRTSQEKMRALFEAMTELVVIVSMQGNQLENIEIAPMNPHGVDQPDAEIISQTVASFLQEPTAPLWLNQVQQALTTQQILSFDYSLGVGEEQLWFSARISPISDTSVLWVARDISDAYRQAAQRKRAEETLRQKNEELASTLQELENTQQELIQSEKMASLGQLIAGVAHEINTPMGAIQASIANISSALENSLQQLPQIFQQLSAERQADFFALLAAQEGKSQELSFREERKCKRALKKQLEAQGIDDADTLAADLVQLGITQDITPFLPLLQDPNCHLVLDTANNLVTQQNNSHNIQLAVEKSSKIVFALKSYVRQNNSGEMSKARIAEGIDVVLTIYQNLLKQGIEVIKDYEDVPEILCYPEELNQVWTNLVHNAIQAMNYEGTLTIKVFEQEHQVVVQFTDSGCGIPPEIQAKIFDAFFTTKPMGEGSGLGLNIVNKIIKKHQGKIQVYSVTGKTTFSIFIPIREMGNGELGADFAANTYHLPPTT